MLPTAGYRFRYLRLWWVRFSCVLGIVFDTYEYECSVGN